MLRSFLRFTTIYPLELLKKSEPPLGQTLLFTSGANGKLYCLQVAQLFGPTRSLTETEKEELV